MTETIGKWYFGEAEKKIKVEFLYSREKKRYYFILHTVTLERRDRYTVETYAPCEIEFFPLLTVKRKSKKSEAQALEILRKYAAQLVQLRAKEAGIKLNGGIEI